MYTLMPRCAGFFDLGAYRRRRHTGGTSRSRWAIQAENVGQPEGLWLFGPIATLAPVACSQGYYSPGAALHSNQITDNATPRYTSDGF